MNVSVVSRQSGHNSTRNLHERSMVSNFGQSDVIMSIVEGRGKAKGEIGLAYIDLHSPVVHLTQFLDNCSYDSIKIKCHTCSPSQIVFPHTLIENNIMMSSLLEHFPNIKYIPIDRRFFNEKKGYDLIHSLGHKNHIWIDIELESKYYTLSSLAALFHYILKVKNVCFICS